MQGWRCGGGKRTMRMWDAGAEKFVQPECCVGQCRIHCPDAEVSIWKCARVRLLAYHSKATRNASRRFCMGHVIQLQFEIEGLGDYSSQAGEGMDYIQLD